MRRVSRSTCLILAIGALATACSAAKEATPTNVRPPRPGVPSTAAEVTGIYRSIHQGLLQLRGNGELVLVVPEGPGAGSGTYTLRDGRMEVRTSSCGQAVGQYDVLVSGKQQAGKAVLNLSAVDEPCAQRGHYLTVDPWVYANS